MKVKTSELTGAALDYAVAVALDWECERQQDCQFIDQYGDRRLVGYYGHGMYQKTVAFNPSTNWAHGGPLLDALMASGTWGIAPGYKGEIMASTTNCEGVPFGDNWVRDQINVSAPTPLIAICRAVVTAKFGEEAEVPDRLIE